MITKTDWRNGEWFDIHNYNRIKNNYEFLYELSQKYFAKFDFIRIKDKNYDDYCFSEYFNNIEENIDRIANATFKVLNFEPTKRFKGNDEAWIHHDINRIERMSILFYNLFSSMENNMLETGVFSTDEDFTAQLLGV